MGNNENSLVAQSFLVFFLNKHHTDFSETTASMGTAGFGPQVLTRVREFSLPAICLFGGLMGQETEQLRQAMGEPVWLQLPMAGWKQRADI